MSPITGGPAGEWPTRRRVLDADPDTPTADDGREGFSERFAKEEPLPCARCWAHGLFHWPSLAGHKPEPPDTPTADDPVQDEIDSGLLAARQWGRDAREEAGHDG